MKCMYAQTRPRFILSSEGVLGGMEFEPMLTPREKSPLPKMSPEEDRTRDAVDSEPKHYQLSYSGPPLAVWIALCCTHLPDGQPQPEFVPSSGIFRRRCMQIWLRFPRCFFLLCILLGLGKVCFSFLSPEQASWPQSIPSGFPWCSAL